MKTGWSCRCQRRPFSASPNLPDGSRAFALLRAQVDIMPTPERLLHIRLWFFSIGRSFQCRSSKESASNPEIACAVK
jgi:hypothetical protein